MQPDVSWQFRLVRLGSIARQFRLMQAELPWQFRLMRHGSDGRNDKRLVLARDKKFLIGVVTVRNTVRDMSAERASSELTPSVEGE